MDSTIFQSLFLFLLISLSGKPFFSYSFLTKLKKSIGKILQSNYEKYVYSTYKSTLAFRDIGSFRFGAENVGENKHDLH